MKTISQKQNITQEVLKRIFQKIPTVIATNNGNSMFILVKDLSKELEAFIFTGKSQTTEFQVFTSEKTGEMITHWEQLGLTVAFSSQQIEYMHHQVRITFPQVSDPVTGKKILIIPWFVSKGRPYPIFVNIYSVWHYYTSEKKSLQLSATATAKLFGIDRFNKSTVCRNLKAMEQLVEDLHLDYPLSAIEHEAASTKDLIDLVPIMLKNSTLAETLYEMENGSASQADGNTVFQHAERIGNAERVLLAFRCIPQECSKVVKEAISTAGVNRDNRKRPKRLCTKRSKRVQRKMEFAKSVQIDNIRKFFITSIRDIILDAAITYHRFLV